MKRLSPQGVAGALAFFLASVSGWAAAGDEPPVRMEPVFVRPQARTHGLGRLTGCSGAAPHSPRIVPRHISLPLRLLHWS